MKFETLNLYVANMKRSIQFYKLLGFNFNEGDENKSYVKISFKVVNLSFYTIESVNNFFDSPNLKLSKGNQFNLSFRVDNPNKIDELYDRMQKNGIQSFKGPLNTEWGQRVLFFKDPDGNLIEICSYLAEK